ncbi:hypothetical protein [Actinoplanes sp. NPDC020271]|uniref:hypothetical protein n=1 Tax=Actinoplanes sp. NPDC020271 TaxID=3363896 RepID=UPI0037A4C15E
MGSDWDWELEVPEQPIGPALRELFAVAAPLGLRPQRPDGLFNLWADGGMRTVASVDEVITVLAAGWSHSQLWTGDTDIWLSCFSGAGREMRPGLVLGSGFLLCWSLGSGIHRRPVPEAAAFRQLHGRLTRLWLDVAQRLGAGQGRVEDEWSVEQAGDEPQVGWWRYLGPGRDLPFPPTPEMVVEELPGGARLIRLLDDPAAVDALRYAAIHERWRDSVGSGGDLDHP